MKRAIVGLLTGLLMATGSAQAQQGQGYELVNPPQPTATGDKIEVVELFWYGCPHCFRLEPSIKRWLESKPADVEYVRIPAILPPAWELLARAYYVAEALGKVEEIHDPLFNAIHAERQRIGTQDALADFFAAHGVDRDTFDKTFRSFSVETKIKRAKLMSERYGINGVPAIIVNGKYRTSGSLAGSNANMLRVVDQLIAQERKAH